jgi:hypothetical protein
LPLLDTAGHNPASCRAKNTPTPQIVKKKQGLGMAKQIHLPFTQIRIGRFLFLLITIGLMFVLRPFLEGFIRISYLMDIFFTAIFLSAVYAVSQKRGVFIVTLFIALLTIASLWINDFTGISAYGMVGNILGTVFMSFTAIMILSYMFREDEVTGDMIMGAICVYFLFGLIWAFVFSILETTQPGSFQMPGEIADKKVFNYYSYVTLTTLGYGDITPISAPARSLALLEAVMGQLYLAVLVARLVGLHISQSMTKKSR